MKNKENRSLDQSLSAVRQLHIALEHTREMIIVSPYARETIACILNYIVEEQSNVDFFIVKTENEQDIEIVKKVVSTLSDLLTELIHILESYEQVLPIENVTDFDNILRDFTAAGGTSFIYTAGADDHTHKVLWPNGNLREMWTYRGDDINAKDGTYLSWHENGIIECIGLYEAGQISGAWHLFDEKGGTNAYIAVPLRSDNTYSEITGEIQDIVGKQEPQEDAEVGLATAVLGSLAAIAAASLFGKKKINKDVASAEKVDAIQDEAKVIKG